MDHRTERRLQGFLRRRLSDAEHIALHRAAGVAERAGARLWGVDWMHDHTTSALAGWYGWAAFPGERLNTPPVHPGPEPAAMNLIRLLEERAAQQTQQLPEERTPLPEAADDGRDGHD